MKPTLNEEIGMSQQGIDYVNSLEVKHDDLSTIYHKALKNTDTGFKYLNNAEENDMHIEKHNKFIEHQRIRKQARNAWICVFVIILLTVILNWKS